MANEHPSGNDMPRTDQEWRQRLDPQQYAVCRCSATEAPFTGKYWDHHGIGTYACVACGAPLFASGDKFDSGTGWPSFFAPNDEAHVARIRDCSHGMERTEITCARCGSHLGQRTAQRACGDLVALGSHGCGGRHGVRRMGRTGRQGTAQQDQPYSVGNRVEDRA